MCPNISYIGPILVLYWSYMLFARIGLPLSPLETALKSEQHSLTRTTFLEQSEAWTSISEREPDPHEAL